MIVTTALSLLRQRECVLLRVGDGGCVFGGAEFSLQAKEERRAELKMTMAKAATALLEGTNAKCAARVVYSEPCRLA